LVSGNKGRTKTDGVENMVLRRIFGMQMDEII
jgi:hypothetical protein